MADNVLGLPGLPAAQQKKISPYEEIGVSGLKAYSGYLQEEFLSELRGPRGVKVYRQMSEGDAIVRAVLMAIELILRAVDWRVEPANDSPEAEKEAEFVEGLIEDTSHTFEDFISEALSMLSFGWAYFEIVYKKRLGPDKKDPKQRSKFSDGRIGVRKLAIRSQDSLLRWELQDDGGIEGMWQIPPLGGGLIMVPLEKGLLIRTTSKKNNPEGFSILRAAYRSWYLLKTVEDMEAIGIERELAGLPVVSIPANYLSSSATAAETAVREDYQKIARDLKFNQQAGVVIPSNHYPDAEGNPTAVPMVEVKLLSTGGRRAIDTDPVVQRHQRNIARSALADFIMLGDTKGSYALSKNKSELFLRTCETFLNQIASVLNRFLLARVWELNGLDRELMPKLAPGRVAPVDLAELGQYIQQLSQSAMPLFPDEGLEDYLRDVGGLPEAGPETVALRNAMMPGGASDLGTADDDTRDPGDLSTEGMFAATGMPRGQKSIDPPFSKENPNHDPSTGEFSSSPGGAFPPRSADTMSEAIGMSSPSGRQSGRSRNAAQARLSRELFGEGGLQRAPTPQPSEKEKLLRQASTLRDLANRGMSVRRFNREADALELAASKL